MRDKTDIKETRHQHYQLYYKNVLVEGGHLTLHSRKGVLTAAHSRIIENLDIVTEKPIDESKALETALTHRKLTVADVREHLPKGQLVLTSLNGDYVKDNYRLAYYFDVYGNGKDANPKDIGEPGRVYVDATTGELIKTIPWSTSVSGILMLPR